jgi:alpha-mannosidase
MTEKKLFLICNAHLDPVWLWTWEEGAAEAISTFRAAAGMCEEYDGFIFCHNEAVLYQWIQEYEPDLFVRIQALVKEKKWHIMGGWYLQPDINMPAGESIVRQIMTGRRYFKKYFGVEPETAVNFDSFGHTRGLVQILKKSGYSSYLFCRPGQDDLSLPSDDFIWVGYDGSKILAHRAADHYNSGMGKAVEKVKLWISRNNKKQTGLLLWGIGNHGGGPSREDLEKLGRYMSEQKGWKISHSIPEDYFDALGSIEKQLSRVEQDLNPWAVGCYTSMSRIKSGHRALENAYYLTEKMASHASLAGVMVYPSAALQEALEDLLFCGFHDILPGSAIPEVEIQALRRMEHGMEILSRVRARAFFALLKGQPRASEDEFPIFVYNPHPYPVEKQIVVEFQPAEPVYDRNLRRIPVITSEEGHVIPSQLEKESSSIAIDWRKKVVFSASLLPSRMHCYSCHLKTEQVKASQSLKSRKDYCFQSDIAEFIIHPETGWLSSYKVKGKSYLNNNGLKVLVLEDYADPWGMQVKGFRKVKGKFQLTSPQESARMAGVLADDLPPIRIIEDGPLRTVVEALFSYNRSSLCLHYIFPKKGSEFEIKLRIFWQEKDTMLKLSLPTPFSSGTCLGQVAYGVEEFYSCDSEQVAQKWEAVVSTGKTHAITVINQGTYGFDFYQGEIRLSMLRSAAYAAHPVGEDVPIVPQDRFTPRIDQGERVFRFWVNGGPGSERLKKIDREALVKNEEPLALCCFPGREGEKPLPGLSLSDDVVQVTAVKLDEENNRLIIRLFEPTGKKRHIELSIPVLELLYSVRLEGFEIKTLAVDLDSKKIYETDLMER